MHRLPAPPAGRARSSLIRLSRRWGIRWRVLILRERAASTFVDPVYQKRLVVRSES
jgi:hypothetical protein